MQTNFSIRGAREMEKLLEELGPRVANRVADQALRAGAKPIVEEAKRLVPVRSGELRDSITTKSERKGEGERVILIGFKPPHSSRAHLTEFGTSTQAAQPFMRPALDSRASLALQEMGRVMAKGLTREAKKLAKPNPR